MTDIFERLRAPFPPDRVSWRIGSTTQDKKKGMALAYIDARDVMDRLDEVVGPGNWQDRYPHAAGKTVCEIDIYIEGRGWVTKSDGAGDSDVEAEKGALSDAFKRAAVRWGIGRYLYDVASVWVEIEAAGRSFKIKDSEHARLSKLLFTDARSAFIATTEIIINNANDATELGKWWNADSQKAQRRDFELTTAEVNALKTRVTNRMEELKQQKAAA